MDLPLTLEKGCMTNLLWRVELPETLDAHRLVQCLTDDPRFGLVRNIRDFFLLNEPLGGTIALVPKTRRVQLRILYTTPPDLRVQAARVVNHELSKVCQTLLEHP